MVPMNVGRSPSVCLRCQAVIGKRSNAISTVQRVCSNGILSWPSNARSNQSLAIVPTSHEPFFGPALEVRVVSAAHEPPFFSSNLNDAAKALDDFRRLSSRRVRFLRSIPAICSAIALETAPLQSVSAPESSEKEPTLFTAILPEANAALVPHERFRSLLQSTTNDKTIRKILRVQLLRCRHPTEVLRIVAAALLEDRFARNLTILDEPMTRAMYRCRETVSDPVVLNTLNAVISRFRHGSLHVAPTLVFLSAKFAARSRSLSAMKKALRTIREHNLVMTSNVFRSIIAKCSIGHRGLGEIRNGRWRRSDLLQVLKGFDDCRHLPKHQQYHLETFLDRSDWLFLHGFIAALARCKDTKSLWQEWEIWKRSLSRRQPKLLGAPETASLAEQGRFSYRVDTRARGDEWFLEQGVFSGDLEMAWRMLAERGTRFSQLRTKIKDKLLEGIQFCPEELWVPEMRAELLAKYDRDLQSIESALGLKWVSQHGTSNETKSSCVYGVMHDHSILDNGGHHEVIEDWESSLERLASPDFKLHPDHGYPWESEPLSGMSGDQI